MSGKCFSCASQFGFFKKEQGCPSCGFAFCKDCLKQKIAVPRRNHEVHKVCKRCYKVLSGAVYDTPSKFSPPDALKRRLAALENKEVSADGEISGRHRGVSSQTNKGMSKEDIALQQRLDKLKKERQKDLPSTPSEKEIEARLKNLKDDKKPPPSDEEMARRLAVLKGQDPDTVNKLPILLKPTVRRNEQQQIDDLLGEICDEVLIDSQTGGASSPTTDVSLPKNSGSAEETKSSEVELRDVNRLMNEVAAELEIDAQKALQGLQQDKELMERLNQLKKDRKSKGQSGEEDTKGNSETSDNEDSEDEEQAMKRIIKQAVEQCKLDDEFEETGTKTEFSSRHKKGVKTKGKKPSPPEVLDNHDSDPDELPWCCICNEDAAVRCVGCDYDLYCHRCFKEGHDRYDIADHRTVPFKQRKK